MTSRPVLILGARSDIGLALAHRFAAEGRAIQLAARDLDALQADQQNISLRHGVPVTKHRFDALAFDQIDAFFDSLPDMPGIVISVVGYLGDQSDTEQDPAKARLTVDTNFTGPTIALERAARRLVQLNEDTAIVGVSSIAGDRGRTTNYWYGAAKAGFSTALSGLRQKYARTTVHVMTAKPGFVATRMTEHMDLPSALTATPEAIADGIVRGLKKRRRIVTPFQWRIIMAIIKAMPESVFERMKF